jgi:Cysteinyl-tRNA synthetase
MEGWENLKRITPSAKSSVDFRELRAKCYAAMDDDLNTPIVISHLFDATRDINNVVSGSATISAQDLDELRETFRIFMFDIMGLKETSGSSDDREKAYGEVVDMLLEQRQRAKASKDWATSDMIRNKLAELGFEVKDTKEGFEWKLNK